MAGRLRHRLLGPLWEVIKVIVSKYPLGFLLPVIFAKFVSGVLIRVSVRKFPKGMFLPVILPKLFVGKHLRIGQCIGQSLRCSLLWGPARRGRPVLCGLWK